MSDQFTAKQLCEVARINPGVYTQWKARGFVRCEKPVSGTGNTQYYTIEDVIWVAVIASLVKLKMPIAEAVSIVYGLHAWDDDDAVLGIWLSYPKPQEAGYSSIPTLKSEVLRRRDVQRIADEHDDVIFVSLSRIEQRVRKLLESGQVKRVADTEVTEQSLNFREQNKKWIERNIILVSDQSRLATEREEASSEE